MLLLFLEIGVGGVFGWVLGWELGGMLGKHPPFNFSLFIAILSDMGGCWGVFAKIIFLYENRHCL